MYIRTDPRVLAFQPLPNQTCKFEAKMRLDQVLDETAATQN